MAKSTTEQAVERVCAELGYTTIKDKQDSISCKCRWVLKLSIPSPSPVLFPFLSASHQDFSTLCAHWLKTHCSTNVCCWPSLPVHKQDSILQLQPSRDRHLITTSVKLNVNKLQSNVPAHTYFYSRGTVWLGTTSQGMM